MASSPAFSVMNEMKKSCVDQLQNTEHATARQSMWRTVTATRCVLNVEMILNNFYSPINLVVNNRK